MPQSPVKTTLFTSEIIAGNGIQISPASGTGPVTISVGGAGLTALIQAVIAAGGVNITGTSELTGAVSGAGFLAALLAWFQTNAGTFTLNGATPVVVAAPSVTANSQILITLKTPEGTVGAQPALVTITPGTGFHVAGTALDTSVYNYTIIG
jgi:hypothetical protein